MSRLLSWAVAAAAYALLVIMLATAAPAQMQMRTQCGPHARIVAVLAGRFGEAPKAIGTVDEKRFMQVFVSDAGSWTIVVTTTNGHSCIVAAGENWEDVPFLPGRRS